MSYVLALVNKNYIRKNKKTLRSIQCNVSFCIIMAIGTEVCDILFWSYVTMCVY